MQAQFRGLMAIHLLARTFDLFVFSGGFVYRGEKYKDLFYGNYIWSDFTT